MAVISGPADPSKLSLQNSVLTVEQLQTTPSMDDGIPKELEYELRVLGCELIQSAGILLRLPQVSMATAQVLFQRYYYVASMRVAAVRDIAMGAMFLASKVEETPRRIRDIINVFSWLFDRYRGVEPRVEGYLGLQYNDFKEGLLSGEMRILCMLGFNVQVQQPHGFMINYLRSLDVAENEQLAQTAWNYLNDGLRTNIYTLYQPSTLACAAIHLAARKHRIPLPTNPPWWEVFDAEEEDLRNIAGEIGRLYRGGARRGLPVTVGEMEVWLGREG
ncbi:cyclin-L1, partial [Fimicolochytrium jonesii]|uniref:cyclin-L1 n=1 Tax=Fimicolochytrium jonesii TaxID=1396493 RepID=UPI0022FEB037